MPKKRTLQTTQHCWCIFQPCGDIGKSAVSLVLLCQQIRLVFNSDVTGRTFMFHFVELDVHRLRLVIRWEALPTRGHRDPHRDGTGRYL